MEEYIKALEEENRKLKADGKELAFEYLKQKLEYEKKLNNLEIDLLNLIRKYDKLLELHYGC